MLRQFFYLIYSLYFFVVVVVSFVLFSLTILPAYPFLGQRKHFYYALWAKKWGQTILWLTGLSPKVTGELPKDKGPWIFLLNHQSQLDILIALAFLPAGFLFVAKEELFKIPLLGHSMRFCGYIPIRRNQSRKSAETLNQLKQLIAEGTSVLIFPEGTRSLTGKLGPIKRGSLVLAYESKTRSIPIVMNPAYQIMPKGSFFLRPQHIRITVGQPITFDWNDPKPDYTAQAEQIHGIMSELLASIKV